VVQYVQLSSMKLRELCRRGNDLSGFVALWLEAALRLQGESTRAARAPCPGTYDVYDCQGTSMWRLLQDVKATRSALGPCLTLGEAHYPNNLCRCFVINAPPLAAAAWAVAKPFLSERTQRKVVLSTGVPAELVATAGSDIVSRLRSHDQVTGPPQRG